MDLIIDDEYIESKKQVLDTQINTMGVIIYRFQKIIKELCQSGVELGKTAEALEAFAAYLEQLYSTGDFANLSRQVDVFCSSYLEEVDKIDGDLYG